MEPTGTVSIRLTPDKITALNAIAEQQQHSRNQIMNQAIDYYLEMHQAWEDGIKAAIQQVEEGKDLPAKEVFDEVRSEFWKSE
jgi:predicted transcriptional regulator